MNETLLKSSIIKFHFLMVVLTFLVSFTPNFQVQAQSDRPQWWFTYNHTGRFSERWGYAFDLNHRSNGVVPFNSTLSAARMGMTYHTQTGFRITGGYAWFGTNVQGRQKIWLQENRLYQQIQYNHSNSKNNFVHRIRNEQRWRQQFFDIDSDEVFRDLTTRIRYLFQLDGPIPRDPSRKTNLKWQVANEIFFHTRERVGDALFDQNRTLAGVLVSPQKSNLSMAFLYQFIIQQQPLLREFQPIHSFRLTVFHQFDFRKKKIIPVDEIPVID